MQTFLPYADFDRTARCLDYRRLGKQRVEARQILDVLEGRSNGWAKHPAVAMWRGCESGLKIYFNCISKEWMRRGYKHNMGFFDIDMAVMPSWLGNEDFHKSHQSNLIRKFPEHYIPIFGNVPSDLEYIWPTNNLTKFDEA